MTDAQPTTSATTVTATDSRYRSSPMSGTVLPLWIAAISLAVIAVVLTIASFELLQAVRSTQASVEQLQQQVQQLKSALGGLLGR